MLPPTWLIVYCPQVAVAVGLGVAVGVVVAVAVAVDVGVKVAVAAGVGVNVAVATAVGVGVAEGHGVVSNSTVLTTVVAVLKPSATNTRPSGSVPCACPARLPIIAGPALKVPLLMVKMCVPVAEAPVESAPSVISSWPVPKGEMAP